VLSQEQLTRLSLVRYLLRQAESQIGQPSPLRSLALLPLHDAAEIFLDLAAEYLKLPASRREFSDYWKLFRNVSPPVTLPMERGMDKLNRARVALKHHGQLPNDNQLRNYLFTVQSFLDEASPLCFNLAIEDVSLVALIRDLQARELLERAISRLRTGDLREALDDAAIAYARRSAFARRRLHIPFWDSDLGRGFGISSDLRREVRHSVERVLEGISRHYDEAIGLVSLGIDIRDYDLFRSLTPVVHLFSGGEAQTQWMQKRAPTEDQARWCVDFVINFVLALEAPGPLAATLDGRMTSDESL
jgi:hypothetical protein